MNHQRFLLLQIARKGHHGNGSRTAARFEFWDEFPREVIGAKHENVRMSNLLSKRVVATYNA